MDLWDCVFVVVTLTPCQSKHFGLFLCSLWAVFFFTFFSFSHSIKAIISFMQCSFVCCNIFIALFSAVVFFHSVCYSAFAFSICYHQNKYSEHLWFSFSCSAISCYILYFRIYFICICLSIRFVHNSNCTVYKCTLYRHYEHTYIWNMEYNLVFRYHQQLNSSWMPFTILFSLDGSFYVVVLFYIFFSLVQPFYRLFIFQQFYCSIFGFFNIHFAFAYSLMRDGCGIVKWIDGRRETKNPRKIVNC